MSEETHDYLLTGGPPPATAEAHPCYLVEGECMCRYQPANKGGNPCSCYRRWVREGRPAQP